MQMPTVYNDDILDVESHYPDGLPHRPAVYSMVYPPVGFFPFAGTGNGDYYGFYWPIGREDSLPIVAYSSHDAYAIIPEHGDLQSAGRCQLARSKEHELTYEFRCDFASAKEPLPKVDIAGGIAVDDHR